jgi:hypothetical protein
LTEVLRGGRDRFTRNEGHGKSDGKPSEADDSRSEADDYGVTVDQSREKASESLSLKTKVMPETAYERDF